MCGIPELLRRLDDILARRSTHLRPKRNVRLVVPADQVRPNDWLNGGCVDKVTLRVMKEPGRGRCCADRKVLIEIRSRFGTHWEAYPPSRQLTVARMERG